MEKKTMSYDVTVHLERTILEQLEFDFEFADDLPAGL